jgi:apolipoprotein N-acyltransferase
MLITLLLTCILPKNPTNRNTNYGNYEEISRKVLSGEINFKKIKHKSEFLVDLLLGFKKIKPRSGFLVDLLLGFIPADSDGNKSAKNNIPSILGFSLLIASILFGIYNVEFREVTETPERNCKISIVHPMISQKSKLTPGNFTKNLQAHIGLSRLDTADGSKRLVVWPEYAVNTTVSDELLKYIGSFIKSPDTFIITGIDGGDSSGNPYNSLIVLNDRGEAVCQYDKKHLLPFGEFIPEVLLQMRLRKVTSGMRNFAKGARSRLLNIGDGFPRLNAVICFEMAFPGEIVENKDETDCILSITNDAWFDENEEASKHSTVLLDESKEAVQHFKMSIFRAIEEGLPVIRSSNGGVSCIIGCRGEVLYSAPKGFLIGTNKYGMRGRRSAAIKKELWANRQDTINCDFKCSKIQTLYSKFGNTPILIILFITIAGCLIRSPVRNFKSKR